MESWIPFFIVVTALAVVLQAVVLAALFFQIRRTSERVEQIASDLQSNLTPVLSRLQLLVEDISPRISGITADAAELTRLARGQAQKMDRVITEMTERLRLQLIHVDNILTGVVETVEVAGSQLKKTVLGPVANATAVIRGIQTGLDFFRATRRRSVPPEPVSEQQQDEGMFI